MEENLIRLILWLVFIGVWLVSGIAKKRRDDRKVASGEAPSSEEIREYFGEDEPEEEHHAPQEDEFRKFLRTIAGVEEKRPESSPGAARGGKPSKPPAGEKTRPAVSYAEPAPGPEYRPKPAPAAPPPERAGWGAEKLRKAVIFSEILSPPRALRPYRAVKRDSFRS